MKKKVNEKQAAPSSRQRIMTSALRLFARQGFTGTGLRELAAEAQVNLAMINYCFGSKKELLKEILDGFLSGYLDIAREELSGRDDPLRKIERFVHRAVDYFQARPEALLITIAELPRDDPEIIEYKAAWGRKMMEIVEGEICRPLAVDGRPPLSPRLLAPMLTSVMASRFLFAPLMERLEPDRKLPLGRAYAEMAGRFILGGVRGMHES